MTKIFALCMLASIHGCKSTKKEEHVPVKKHIRGHAKRQTGEPRSTSAPKPAIFEGRLIRYFRNNKKRMIYKWLHYFEIYERHLSRYRNKEVVVVEIGVWHGGSLQMWKDYFGPRAHIIGIDIDPRCKSLEEEQIEVHIGDQADRKFWAAFKKKVPQVDILIDDGGHRMNQQVTTFEEMFPHMSTNGTYICEDLHTSYWPKYDGGYLKPNTFIEMSKKLIDQLNAWHSKDPQRLFITPFTRSAYSMHYYDSLLVIEKRPMQPSKAIKTGKESF